MTDPERPLEIQPSQAAVYRRYAQLQSIREERLPDASADGLAGLLLTCVGFGREGAELALAATICGGTFLGIDPSTEHLKAAVRNGACDFMVNTLDESLRVLKNEIRKKNPLSVGLLGEATSILLAMLDRGVQPDLIVESDTSPIETAPTYQKAFTEFARRGSIQVDAQPSTFDMIQVRWTASSIADLRRMDALALQQLPADDVIRRRWLQQAPAYFHRQRPLQRVLALQQEELPRLKDAFVDAISAGEIQSPVNLHWQTAEGSNESVVL